MQCFIRKRPIFPREIKGNEFDVISCGPSQKTCTVHDARMKADMRNRTMTHYSKMTTPEEDEAAAVKLLFYKSPAAASAALKIQNMFYKSRGKSEDRATRNKRHKAEVALDFSIFKR